LLRQRIEAFQSRGRVDRREYDLFNEPNWHSILGGQDIRPQRSDPLDDFVELEQVKRALSQMRGSIRKTAESLPTHQDYLSQYCASTPPAAS
jgi:tryptophan halogenase